MIVKTILENPRKRSPSLCLVFVISVHKRVVEDSIWRVVLHGCVVHVDVHGEVMLLLAAT